MLCTVILALGLTIASCPKPPPPRDEAAEVLIEQEKRQKTEFEEALAKRDKLYRGLDRCTDCGKLNTYPFPKE
ncbi:hypothetical protein GGE65_007843 [Skermanella aerolata]